MKGSYCGTYASMKLWSKAFEMLLLYCMCMYVCICIRYCSKGKSRVINRWLSLNKGLSGVSNMEEEAKIVKATETLK